MNIKIEYDGAWPNLCSGHLIVNIDDMRYDFGNHCLMSGGDVYFDDDWNETIKHGPWAVNFPENFPEEYKKATIEAINDQIPWGCCGGCI
jgi:hypothetical protein